MARRAPVHAPLHAPPRRFFPRHAPQIQGSRGIGEGSSEMPHALEQFFVWAAFDGCGPADEVGPGAKKCNDRAVPLGAVPEAAIDPPAVRAE